MLERPQINTWVMQRCIHHLAGDTLSFQAQSSLQVCFGLFEGVSLFFWILFCLVILIFKAKNHTTWEWQKAFCLLILFICLFLLQHFQFSSNMPSLTNICIVTESLSNSKFCCSSDSVWRADSFQKLVLIWSCCLFWFL